MINPNYPYPAYCKVAAYPMSIAYRLAPPSPLAIVVWDGVVTLDEWLAHLTQMFADPDYRGVTSQLTDTRRAEFHASVTLDAVRKTLTSLASRRTVAIKKLAVVAGKEWERLKVLEQVGGLLGVDAIVFNDLERACLWLNVDPAMAEAETEQLRLKLREPAKGA